MFQGVMSRIRTIYDYCYPATEVTVETTAQPAVVSSQSREHVLTPRNHPETSNDSLSSAPDTPTQDNSSLESDDDDEPFYLEEEQQARFFQAALTELKNSVRKITNPVIKLRATDVQNKLEAMYNKGEDPTKLTPYLRITTKLINSNPGPERQGIATEYKQLTAQAQSSHSPAMQALGVAMLLLSVFIITSCALSIPIVPIAGTAGLIGGAALLAIGMGFFAYGRPRPDDTRALMKELSDSIENEARPQIRTH